MNKHYILDQPHPACYGVLALEYARQAYISWDLDLETLAYVELIQSAVNNITSLELAVQN